MAIEKTVVATYDYADADGKLVYQVVRYHPKSFSQRQPDGKGGWLNSLKGVETVLYNLPALAATEVVWLCEGEKDANRLISEGLVATTSPGGAGNWKPHYAQSLAGKKIIAVPHNDAEGERYMNQASVSLKNVAHEVLVCRLPGLLPKGDVSDWLDAGNKVEDLAKHCQKPDTEPKLAIRGSIYEFKWGAFTASVSRTREDRQGQTSGEIKVCTNTLGLDPVLTQSKLNLLSPRSQSDLVKRLLEKCPSQNWEHIIEVICQETLAALRLGEPVVYVGTNPVRIIPDRFLLYPFLVADQPNVLFGEGATGKSTFAALLALLVRTGDRVAGVETREQGNVLYLDYESCEEDVNDQAAALKAGCGIDESHDFAYRFCSQPLVDEVAEIQQLVLETGAKLVIVDSIGYACGSTLSDPKDPVIRYFQALRTLRVTTLSIDHISKEKPNETYGSIYKFNSARNIWQARTSREPGSNELTVGFYHRKINRGQLCKPRGYTMRFQNNGLAIVVEQTDLLSLPELAEGANAKDRIARLLTRGAMPITKIAVDLEMSEATIRQSLHRYKDKLFVKVGGDWGLLSPKEAL